MTMCEKYTFLICGHLSDYFPTVSFQFNMQFWFFFFFFYRIFISNKYVLLNIELSLALNIMAKLIKVHEVLNIIQVGWVLQ